jgi:hypothetical protein
MIYDKNDDLACASYINYLPILSSLHPDTPSFPFTDILWQNQAIGDIVFWKMLETTQSGQSYIGNIADTNWMIVGYADFNKDGKPDILWQNQATGDISIWLMDGTNVIRALAGGGVADPNWRVVSAADFNGDGYPDYLWQHQVRGDLYTWFTSWDTWWDSIVITGGAPAGGITDTNWRIAGSGDFNSDGKPDYLWQHQVTGNLYIWLMNGTTATSGIPLDGKGDTHWKAVSIADFNYDGKPDILWRDQTTGQNEVWYMNGTTMTGTDPIDTVADTNWMIAGPK